MLSIRNGRLTEKLITQVQVKMKFIILIIIKFFFISALFIISNGDLYLRDSEQREIFFDSYSSWFKGVFNQGAEIVGYVIESKWLPQNDFSES